jgi:hypothetical protein
MTPRRSLEFLDRRGEIGGPNCNARLDGRQRPESMPAATGDLAQPIGDLAIAELPRMPAERRTASGVTLDARSISAASASSWPWLRAQVTVKAIMLSIEFSGVRSGGPLR